MKNKKNTIIIIGAVILLFLIIGVLILFNNSKGKLVELTYSDVMTKLDNEETFVLCISKTTCSHCADYKPRLEKVAKEYGIDLYFIDIDKYSDEEQDDFVSKITFDGSTPTTVFIKNGTEETTANRIFGAVNTNKIVEKLKNNGFIE